MGINQIFKNTLFSSFSSKILNVCVIHICFFIQIQKFDRPEGRVLISGHWDPNTDQWKYLNTDTGKGNIIIIDIANFTAQ